MSELSVFSPTCLVFCDGSDTRRIQLNFPHEYICSGVDDNALVEAVRQCHFENALS
jgi:hypothetical protein